MADKLFFSSRSVDKLPGEGAKEHGDSGEYKALARIGDWRKVLSNCHTAPFFWRGYTWNSIEHAFQAMKNGLQDFDKLYHFTVESGHFIGQGDGSMANIHRKHTMLTRGNVDRWVQTSESVLQGAATAKYAQNADASMVLDATGDAELFQVAPRGRSHRFKHLESIRARRRAAARCEPVKPAPPSEGDEFYIKICDVVKYAENVWENE